MSEERPVPTTAKLKTVAAANEHEGATESNANEKDDEAIDSHGHTSDKPKELSEYHSDMLYTFNSETNVLPAEDGSQLVTQRNFLVPTEEAHLSMPDGTVDFAAGKYVNTCLHVCVSACCYTCVGVYLDHMYPSNDGTIRLLYFNKAVVCMCMICHI